MCVSVSCARMQKCMHAEQCECVGLKDEIAQHSAVFFAQVEL